MRFERSLLALFLAISLVTVGCAGPAGEQVEDAEAMTLSPGTDAGMPLVLNETNNTEDVTVSTSEAGVEASLSEPGEDAPEGFAGWLTVSASKDAEDGQRIIEVSVDDEERELPVTVDEADEPVEMGQTANLTFSARTLEGELVLTNDANATSAPIPQAASFQEPRSFGPTSVQISQRSQLPTELVQAINGSEVGHSLTVEVPEVFGPEKVEDQTAREETIERETEIPNQLDLPRRQAQQLIPQDAQEGDEVDVPVTRDGQGVPYVIESLGERQVSLAMALDEGANVTLYEAWPDQAQVTNTTGENATIQLSPDVKEGHTLTWNENWGNVTEVTSYTNETIVLRHTPEIGTTYETTDRRSQQAIETEVVDLTEDQVILEQTNPHPLAGQTIVFDVTIESAQDAPQQPRPPQRPQR